MKFIEIPDATNRLTVIPLDNIAYIASYDDRVVRIYLRQIAMTGPSTVVWHISTLLTVHEVLARIAGAQ